MKLSRRRLSHHLAFAGLDEGTSYFGLPTATASVSATPRQHPDLAEVRGQAQVKRALEIVAAGGHSLLMSGPPGSGKSMLAARLPVLIDQAGDFAAAAAELRALMFIERFSEEVDARIDASHDAMDSANRGQ